MRPKNEADETEHSTDSTDEEPATGRLVDTGGWDEYFVGKVPADD